MWTKARRARSRRHDARPLGALVGLALAALGCGTNAGEPHAGMTALVASDQAWTLWYAAPPWEVVERSDDTAVLRVPPGHDDLVAPGAAGAAVGLLLRVRVGTARQWLDEQTRAAAALGATEVGPASELPLARGTAIVLHLAQADGARTLAATDLPAGRALTMEFRALQPLATSRELRAMIQSVEVRAP